jgi:asparagine synthase (glutamine-hydrolysing)
VERLLAGTLARRATVASEQAEASVHRALGDGATILRLGPLTLGCTGPPPPRSDGELVCVADADLHDPDGHRPPDPQPAEQVIATAYARRGERGLARLRGGFAAAIWHSPTQTGLLARDHFGQRPLFLIDHDGRLVFASEIGVLLRMLHRRPPPDRLAMAHWLALGALPPDRTLHRGVVPLRPAHLITLERSSVQRPFWSPVYRRPDRMPLDEAVERVRAAVERSIARRLPTAGEVGLRLGGGIDAATVGAVARASHPRLGLCAYSLTFPHHPAVDEAERIATIVRALDMRAHTRAVEPQSLLGAARQFQSTWHTPLPSVNHAFMRPLVCRAGTEVAVLLDGEGGDELFGLVPYLLGDLLRAGRLPTALAMARRFPGAGSRPPLRQAARVARYWGLRGAMPWRLERLWARRRDHPSGPSLWLSPADRGTVAEAYDPVAWKRSPAPRWWSWLSWTLTRGREAVGAQDYLRRLAHASGAASCHPFLDDVDLVETVLSLPPESAFDPCVNRPIPRRMTAGILPDSVRLDSHKVFWNDVVEDCLLRFDHRAIGSLLNDRTAPVWEFADNRAARRRIGAEGGAIDPTLALPLWNLLTADIWLRHQADDERPPQD